MLIACTGTYERRFKKEEEKGKGLGVTWEGLVITHELYDAQGKNTKFIPVFFSRPDSQHIPSVLRETTRYDLSTEKGYEELYRRLTNQPRITAPKLGPLRTLQRLVRKMEQPSEREPESGIVRLGLAGAGSQVFISRKFKIISIWKNGENTDLLDGYSGHPLDKNNPHFGAGTGSKDINEELTHLVDLPESTAWYVVFYRLDFPPLQNCPFPDEVLRRVDAGETFSMP